MEDPNFQSTEHWLDLDESIIKSKKCVELMVDNRYMDAIEQAERFAEYSLYHSHCRSMLLFFKVYMSLELPEAKKAQEASEHTLKFCEDIRKRTIRDNFIVKLFFEHDYQQFSDDELHVELIRAEQTIFGTLMEFFIDQSIFVLMKFSYRLRAAYMTLKSFAKIIDSKEWSSEVSENTFRTGVKLGLGMFNLMFSMVPARLMSILSLVGFQGSKYEGLALLREAGAANDIRSFVAQIALSMYECYLDQMWNVHTTNTQNTQHYVENASNINSLSVWFSLFKGRIALIEHDLERAKDNFESCVLLKNRLDIKQLTILYHWELIWCYALMGDWKSATRWCYELRNMCVWSQATLCYLEASFCIMAQEVRLIKKRQQPHKVQRKRKSKHKQKLDAENKQENGDGMSKQNSTNDNEDEENSNNNNINHILNIENENDAQLNNKIHELLIQVPDRVKRYAGRRIPMEKFACEKVIKYKHDGRIVVPAYELFIGWNHLIFIEGKEQYLLPIINHVDNLLQALTTDLDDDSYFLLMLVKGACFRLLHRYEEAKTCLMEIVKNKKTIKHDRHLYPFGCLELGIVLIAEEQFDDSQKWLLEARHSIKKEDPMELFVHFRVGKALRLMRKIKEAQQQQQLNGNGNGNGLPTNIDDR